MSDSDMEAMLRRVFERNLHQQIEDAVLYGHVPTETERAEPPVTIEMRAVVFADLPASIKRALEVFVVIARGGVVVCRLPAWRWRDVQRMAEAHLKEKGESRG